MPIPLVASHGWNWSRCADPSCPLVLLVSIAATDIPMPRMNSRRQPAFRRHFYLNRSRCMLLVSNLDCGLSHTHPELEWFRLQLHGTSTSRSPPVDMSVQVMIIIIISALQYAPGSALQFFFSQGNWTSWKHQFFISYCHGDRYGSLH